MTGPEVTWVGFPDTEGWPREFGSEDHPEFLSGPYRHPPEQEPVEPEEGTDESS